MNQNITSYPLTCQQCSAPIPADSDMRVFVKSSNWVNIYFECSECKFVTSIEIMPNSQNEEWFSLSKSVQVNFPA